MSGSLTNIRRASKTAGPDRSLTLIAPAPLLSSPLPQPTPSQGGGTATHRQEWDQGLGHTRGHTRTRNLSRHGLGSEIHTVDHATPQTIQPRLARYRSAPRGGGSGRPGGLRRGAERERMARPVGGHGRSGAKRDRRRGPTRPSFLRPAPVPSGAPPAGRDGRGSDPISSGRAGGGGGIGEI